MWKLTRRETFSFIFLLYTNLHLFLNLFYIDFYINLLIRNLFIYTIIDLIWIIIDKKINISKNELIVHHIATIVLLNSNFNNDNKIILISIEFSTLMLFFLKICNNKLKKIFYYLFIISWFGSRIIGLYFFYIYLKFIYIENNIEYLNQIEVHFSFLIIYLLSLKWTLDFLKLTKQTCYTSILLSLPIYYNIYVITNQKFIAVFNLTIISFVHHLIKNKITKSLDEFAITFCCLTYLNYNYILIFIGSIISFLLKYYFDNSRFNQVVYLKTLLYFSLINEKIKITALFIILSFYLYHKYKQTKLWHLSNGIYLTIATNFIN